MKDSQAILLHQKTIFAVSKVLAESVWKEVVVKRSYSNLSRLLGQICATGVGTSPGKSENAAVQHSCLLVVSKH